MESARVSIRVHPGARHDELSASRGGLLHAGVTAADPGEAANGALIALLARRLHVEPDRVTIVSGAELRVKQLRIEGLAQAEAEARLQSLAAPRRQARRRALTLAVALAVLVIVVIALTGGSGKTPSSTASNAGDGGVAISSANAAAPARSGRRPRHTKRHAKPGGPPHRAATDPGRLPQTAARPSAATREFAARMHGLWAAISGRPVAHAAAAFFPKAAYVQLKAIGDPAGDFTNRLYAEYRQDIAAAHELLGAGAAASRLLRTDVVAADAHWVPAHVCANGLGYWEMPNARLVYRERGEVRSIGIASMISWRGVWYVIHLGAITRHTAGGTVSSPAVGPGTPAPSSTC